MSSREVAIAHFLSLGAQLSQREGDGTIRGIQLRNRSVNDDDLIYLSAFHEELDVIGLENTGVTDIGLKHLCSLPILDNVDLTNTSVTDAGLDVLASIKTLEYVHVE